MKIENFATGPFAVWFISAFGIGVGLAAAFLTYRHASPPKSPDAKPEVRQDAFERFKTWTDFWKYFLVSFALVLITTLLGNTLKERELAVAKAKQDSELLNNEQENLGHFLQYVVGPLKQQARFAAYFKYVTRDPDARQRWSAYADFVANIETPQQQAKLAQLEAEQKKLSPSDPKQTELSKDRDEIQAKLDFNNAILRPIRSVTDITFFTAGLEIDSDGAPNAYRSDGTGLDYLANAGRPGAWYGLVTDEHGQPVVQGPNGPSPGSYIAPTSLVDEIKARTDPLRYVDSTAIPYITLPARQAEEAGIKLGDFAAVVNLKNQQFCYAIFANTGPSHRYGEGSIALARQLGLPSNPRLPGAPDGVAYKIFPGSGNGKPRTVKEINREGERLLKAWGGKELILKAFQPRRMTVSQTSD